MQEVTQRAYICVAATHWQMVEHELDLTHTNINEKVVHDACCHVPYVIPASILLLTRLLIETLELTCGSMLQQIIGGRDDWSVC